MSEDFTVDEMKAIEGMVPVPNVSKLNHSQVPVVYEEACRAVVACTTINEAKYWSDKADALSAWAKIYNEDKVTIEAKRLKLHAYRRMAELADEIMPSWRAERGFRCASVPIILKDYGIPEGQARIIGRIGELPASKVKQAIDQKKPPTPSTLALVDSTAQPDWTRIKRTLSSLISLTKDLNVTRLAKKMDAFERERAYDLAHDANVWTFRLMEEIADIDQDKQKKAG